MVRVTRTDFIRKCNHIKMQNNIISKSLFNLFREYKNRYFIFVEPGGNYGDYLIYKGAQKLARLANVTYQTVSRETFMASQYPDEAVIYIHGSGGYVPIWDVTPKICRKAIREHKGTVIIGPTTFSDNSTFLINTIAEDLECTIAERVIVFARDKTSFEVLTKVTGEKSELYLDHDTALNLETGDILKTKIDAKYVLYAIRDDKEAINIPKRNNLWVWVDPVSAKADLNLKQWIFLHSRAKKIITNRLHSAILGTVLDIPVTLMPNSYHKNHSVWEYSLADRGVMWQEKISNDKVGASLNATPVLSKFLSSHIFQRALKLYYGVGYKDLHSPAIEDLIRV